MYLGALLARCEIRTNKYISLQFPKEMNTRGSKTDAFYSFSHKFTEFWLKKRNYHTITWWISCYDFKTTFIMLGDLKTDAFEH